MLVITFYNDVFHINHSQSFSRSLICLIVRVLPLVELMIVVAIIGIWLLLLFLTLFQCSIRRNCSEIPSET